MSAEYGLAAITGFALFVFFEWFPWVKDKFDALTEQGKRLVMLAALVIVTVVIFALACIPSSPVHMVQCSESGAWDLVLMFIAALVSNQSGHRLLKQPKKEPVIIPDIEDGA